MRLTAADRPVPSANRSPNRRSGGGKGGRQRRRRSLLGHLVYWSFIVVLWGMIGVAGLIAYYASRLPPIHSLEVPKRPPNIQILASNGEALANRGSMGGAAVLLKNLPSHVGDAFVAIEDRRFHSHYGVDPIGFSRAMLRNIFAGRLVEGGSTITQQLAKNLFLTQERTFERKAQEAILAVWLERNYSKAQILEMYLNRVYFGAGAYGIEAAAQRYFDKPAKALTIAEAAMLAGLVKAPSNLAPTKNLKGAQERSKLVLGAMLEQGLIAAKDSKAALAKLARPAAGSGDSSVNYVADWVMDLLDDHVGELAQDVVVETTIDPALQMAAETALRQALAKNAAKLNVDQGAIVVMEPNGAVKALVGGRSYEESQFNRAVTAHRQPGSTFKPFVYLAALERGLTPASIRDDAPVSLAGWKPADFHNEYRGPVSLSTALALSLNTVAVRLCAEVGPKTVVATAQRLGISSALQPNPSIALGTSEVTPLEITAAYAAFANGGHAVAPYVVTRVRTVRGKRLFQRRPPAAPIVAASDKVGMMNAMMRQTLTIGTAKKFALPGWDAAGKSGTSQNYRDAWFIGYTAHLVTGVWTGNDDGASTRKITGGSLPAEIWNGVMRAGHKGLAPKPLPGQPWQGQSDEALTTASLPDEIDDNPVAIQPVVPRMGANGERLPPPEPSLDEWIQHILGQP